MADEEKAPTPPKIRPWRYLPLLIVLGLAVHLLVPQITSLEHSWTVVKNMTWWAVALAFLAQACSYLGNGYLLHAALASNNKKLPVLKGMLISLASSSIGLVAGGWVGGAAATYGWIRRESQDGTTAVLAGSLPALLNNSVLVVISLVGTSYLLIVHDLSRTQLFEFIIILLILGLLAAGVILMIRRPESTKRIAARLGGSWARMRKKPYDPQQITTSMDRFFATWRSLQHGRWLKPLLGAIGNIGFDLLTLFFLFIAAGHNITPGVLLAGYGLPLILGKMAFMFPGGVGVIEGSMVALYDSLQIPNPVSVVVILGYRLISFWIPTMIGFIAAAYLSRK